MDHCRSPVKRQALRLLQMIRYTLGYPLSVSHVLFEDLEHAVGSKSLRFQKSISQLKIISVQNKVYHVKAREKLY